MQKILIAMLLIIVSFGVEAKTQSGIELIKEISDYDIILNDAEKRRQCEGISIIFNNVTSLRAKGIRPEQTILMVGGIMKNLISQETTKRIVNAVYFHPDLAYVGGFKFTRQVADICMGTFNLNPIQPLK
jgi:hypothetical protein